MKFYRIIILLILFQLIGFYANSQTVLLKKTTNTDSIIPVFGMNRTHYAHFYFSYGFILGAPENSGAQINQWRSFAINLGLRYKLRLFEYDAIGIDAQIENFIYNIKQHGGKRVLDIFEYDNEKLTCFMLSGTAYNRINFDNRGDYLGKYIDFGFKFSYIYRVKHFTSVDFDNYKHESIYYYNKSLFYNKTIQSAVVRIGYGRYILTGQYRLTDLFIENINLPELPRVVIGFQLGLHG